MENYGSRIAQFSDLPLLRSKLKAEQWKALDLLMEHSCSRIEWIFLGFESGRLTEALMLAAPRENCSPVEVVRIYGRSRSNESSYRLFQDAICQAKTLGAHELYCTAPEDPGDASLLSELGFQKWRRIVKFERGSAGPDISAGIDLVNATNFDRAEIVDLIARTSEHSSDSQIQNYRRHKGEIADAEMTLKVMESTRYDPSWWRVAVDGCPIGVIFPVIAFGEPTIGFIGVVKDRRRRGIASALLTEAWSIMNRDGYSHLSAETDVQNIPMHQALARAGFLRLWEKQEWKLEFDSYLS